MTSHVSFMEQSTTRHTLRFRRSASEDFGTSFPTTVHNSVSLIERIITENAETAIDDDEKADGEAAEDEADRTSSSTSSISSTQRSSPSENRPPETTTAWSSSSLTVRLKDTTVAVGNLEIQPEPQVREPHPVAERRSMLDVLTYPRTNRDRLTRSCYNISSNNVSTQPLPVKLDDVLLSQPAAKRQELIKDYRNRRYSSPKFTTLNSEIPSKKSTQVQLSRGSLTAVSMVHTN